MNQSVLIGQTWYQIARKQKPIRQCVGSHTIKGVDTQQDYRFMGYRLPAEQPQVSCEPHLHKTYDHRRTAL